MIIANAKIKRVSMRAINLKVKKGQNCRKEPEKAALSHIKPF